MSRYSALLKCRVKVSLCSFAITQVLCLQVAFAQPESGPGTDPLIDAQSFLVQGDAEAALATIEPYLKAEPRSREGAVIRITAHVELGQTADALRAYDEHIQATGLPDAGLLQMIATAELKTLSSQSSSVVRISALEILARMGDPAALEALASERSARSIGPQRELVLDTALASIGDADALRRIHNLALDPTVVDHTAVAQALQRVSDSSSSEVLQQLLTASNPLVRAIAASTLGSLGANDAIPQLLALLEDPRFYPRAAAAVALRQLGDPRAEPWLHQWLESDAPDIRLLAAEAFASSDNREWVKAIEPLLQNAEGLTRLRAAELLLNREPEPALEVLVAAIDDANPAIRAEAGRILGRAEHVDLAIYRRMLGDRDSSVRLHGADAILRQGPP